MFTRVTHPPATLVAALADRYRLEHELGQGGMATVYLAHDLKHHRQVALKVLKPELAEALGAQRFLKEIQVTANLQHPHILPLYDSGNAGDVLFYVMPLVQGESLRQRLDRDRRLPVDETLRIVRQVAGALDFAHRQGVIHRDIKPENILLHDGEALLADFGIALAASTTGADRMTGTGLSIGTLQYMSPEQATGARDLGAASDIYSLGAVTYEMLAGAPALTGDNQRALMANLMSATPASLSAARAEIPASLEAAVLRALEKEPTDRFATAREFADALVVSSAPAISMSASAAPVSSAGRNSSGTRRRSLALVASTIVLVGIAVAWFALRPGATGENASAPVQIRSIAVLPLDNYSGDPAQDYFAEGMTDELTAALATISQLRVTSRGSATQFHGKNRPATPEIAKALDVDAVVEGSVVRSGDRVRITAQLIDARADKHLWAKSFEGNSGDVLTLQSDLAQAIAREINVQLTPSEQSRLGTARPVDTEAFDAYLRGRYFFNRPSDENLQKAIAQFEQATRLSPTFAPAWSGLSDALLWAGYNEGFTTASAAKPKAQAAVARAVQLDSLSAEAWATQAIFHLWYGLNWELSERDFKRSIALNPNYAYARDQLGMLHAFRGQFAEAIAEGRRASQLDPLSPQVLVDAATALMYKKDFAAARALSRRAGELDPSYFFPVLMDGWILLEEGRFAEAVPALERAKAMNAPPFVTGFLGYALGRSGNRTKARATVAELRRISVGGTPAAFSLGLIELGLGDHALAIARFEQAVMEDSQFLGYFGMDAIFDPLRGEPRFQALLKQLKFSADGREAGLRSQPGSPAGNR